MLSVIAASARNAVIAVCVHRHGVAADAGSAGSRQRLAGEDQQQYQQQWAGKCDAHGNFLNFRAWYEILNRLQELVQLCGRWGSPLHDINLPCTGGVSMHGARQYRPVVTALAMCFVALLAVGACAARADWFDDNAAVNSPGAPSIRVSLGEQRAYFYKGGRLVGVSRVSSGKAGFRTPRGRYRVLSKKARHRSTLYGNYLDRNTHRVVRADVDTRKHRRPPGTYYRGAGMNYFIHFNDGIGFHASADVPGYPASHGCVRLPPEMARKFFRHAPVGTGVTVTQ